MSLKVIGAGFGRTGTLSLKTALEQLGFDRCYHMLEVYGHKNHRSEWAKAHRGEAINWDLLFDGYQATVDWPSCNLWREQAEHYPEARIILSLRDAESWYDSVMNTIYFFSKAARDADEPETRYSGEWAAEIIWNRLFDDRMEDRQHVIDVFNKHNQSVIDEVPPERLLVFEAKQGWQPLCDFLEVPVPDTEYPRSNSTDEFHAMMSKNAGEPT